MAHNNQDPPSIGFVSTYPPTECGIATFTAALRSAIATGRGSDDGLDVIALGGGRAQAHSSEVRYTHLLGDAHSLDRAIEVLQSDDVAVIQHEYGIYGCPDGKEVLDFVIRLDIPTVVILHTVLERPTARQKMILEALVDRSDRAVVLSKSALVRLANRYEVDQRKVLHIPHGAAQALSGPPLSSGTQPLVMTWGLLGPGKGLETSIKAFAGLTDLRPLPRYLILGETHPKIHLSQGDAYLSGLMARSSALGLNDVVEFGGRYLDLDSLVTAIRKANVILIPYESTDQVTSGVLVEAIAAGKPVIATAFPHAIEMLSTGAGVLVPHSDAGAMSSALRRVLTNPQLETRMANQARSRASALFWPAVAQKYEAVFSSLVDDPIPAVPIGSVHSMALSEILAS